MSDPRSKQCRACGVSVNRWRECIIGCRWAIAYCNEHGGDERSVREMKMHVVELHEERNPS